MNIKRIVYFFVPFLILHSFNAKAIPLGDTIIVNPIIKKKKPYPLQPLVLKTSPTGFIIGGVIPFTSEYRFTAEITTGRKQSEQVSISYLGKNIFWAIVEKTAQAPSRDILKVSGWRAQYVHKFYLVNKRHRAPYGFYVAPHFSYTNARISLGLNRYYHQTYFDVRHSTIDLIIGVQTGKIGRLTMDVSTGMGYKSNKVYYHSTSYRITKYDTADFGEFYNNHFHLFFDLSLGYSF